MTENVADESFCYINSIDLSIGEAKFREEDAWSVQQGDDCQASYW